jgi:hypothetical protein
LWGGFGLVVTGVASRESSMMHVDSYEAPDVFHAFLAGRARGETPGRPQYHEIANLERQVAGLHAYVMALLGSRSWRLPTPLDALTS